MKESKGSIGRWISILYRYSHVYFGRKLKKYDIGRGQVTFLVALYKKDGVSQEDLSLYLSIDKGTTAKALKKLEDNGYVMRKTCDMDKRANKVYLTEKAWDIKPVVSKVLKEWTNALTKGFKEEEKAAALNMLERMWLNAEEVFKNDIKQEGKTTNKEESEDEAN